MKERILQFIDYKGFSKRKFYAETGLSNGILDKTSGLSVETLEKIYSVFPEINLEWLITGKGEMLKSSQNITIKDNLNSAIVSNNSGSIGNISVNDRKEDIAVLYERLEHKDREIALLERELSSYKYTEAKLEKANEFANKLYERKIEDLKQRIEDKDKMLDFFEKMNKLK